MRALAWLGAFVVLAGLPFFLGNYYNDVYRKLLLWITLALGYNFLFGICGQVAFSHFAFYGVGAYSIVIFLFQLNLPFPLAILLGVAEVLAPLRDRNQGRIAETRAEDAEVAQLTTAAK